MINVSAASIVTAHHHADNCRSIDCNSAKAGIARYKLSDAFFVVALGNLHTFYSLPELKHGIVIVDRKLPSYDVATHLVMKTICHVEPSDFSGLFPRATGSNADQKSSLRSE